MHDFTAEEARFALAPIASLLGKSVKAQQKLTPGTWQHTMLDANIKALEVASALLEDGGGLDTAITRDDLDAAQEALTSMIERVKNTRASFAPGSAQHTLQRNRLQALDVARSAVMARFETSDSDDTHGHADKTERTTP